MGEGQGVVTDTWSVLAPRGVARRAERERGGRRRCRGGASEGAWHTVDPGPAVSGMVGQKTSTRTI